jgi:hypothetical protein
VTADLERALQHAGIAVRVERRDALAVLVPIEPNAITTDAARRTAIALAAKHGFTHVALELNN